MENHFGLKTRKCKKSDYEFVFSLTKATIWPHLSEYLTPTKKIFDERFQMECKEMKILLKGDKKIGIYQIRKKGKTLHLNKLFLNPTYQNRGIGSFLLSYCDGLGYKRLILQVWDNNKNAIRLYKSKGFKIINKKNHKYTMEKKTEIKWPMI